MRPNLVAFAVLLFVVVNIVGAIILRVTLS
jgi:hypothetical protein